MASDSELHLPQVFTVAAAVPHEGGVDWYPEYGGGRLTVSPGMLVLVPDRLTRSATHVAQLTHAELKVTLLNRQFLPQLRRTRVVIEDGGVRAKASVPGYMGKRLRNALDVAGFEVEERAGQFGRYLG